MNKNVKQKYYEEKVIKNYITIPIQNDHYRI